MLQILPCQHVVENNEAFELRNSVDNSPGVFQECHAPVFVSHNQIRVTILIPVDGGGRDHLQVMCRTCLEISTIGDSHIVAWNANRRFQSS